MNTSFTGDPSSTAQYFPQFSVNIHCCRYWWLKKWEHSTLSFPFWRIYYNFEEGGVIEYQDNEYKMEVDKIYLIAPNTDYRSKIRGNKIPSGGYRLEGGSISSLSPQEKTKILSEATLEHLFIHFSLGFPYDNASLGIYPLTLNENLKSKISYLQKYLSENNDTALFNVQAFLMIQSLICEILLSIDESKWKQSASDIRVAKIINYIENHYDQDLSNEFLANKACMSTNSFSRLFKNEIGVSLQKYIKKKRIDYACMLITHTSMSIDEIAFKTGFSNRFHFTRVFHEIIKTTPAKYKILLSF